MNTVELAHSARVAMVVSLSILLSVACTSTRDDELHGEEPTPEAAGPVNIGEATTALLDHERFSFKVEWEDSGLGSEGGLAVAEGKVDVANDVAQYAPMVDPTGSAEVRIVGDDFYGGPGDGSWEVSRGQPGDSSWMELMPLSGAPVLFLNHLEGLDGKGVRTEVGGQPGRDCREYDVADPDALARTFVACQEDGILRWVRFPSGEGRGPLSMSFDDLGVQFDVERPTENVTEFPDATEELAPTEGLIDEEIVDPPSDD